MESHHSKSDKHPQHHAPGYFITFTTYGTWLHGDKRGSVDFYHNIPHTPVLNPDSERLENNRKQLANKPVTFNQQQRRTVHKTIEEVCQHRYWTIHAINVRTNHVHVVVSAEELPEKIMNDFKSWCTRRLIGTGLIDKGVQVWTRHGSTRYIWKESELKKIGQYVVEGQGEDI